MSLIAIAGMLFSFAAVHEHADPPTITATVTPVPHDRTVIWRHERDGLRLRLTVIGSAPLRVELPPVLLDANSGLLWSIQPVGVARLTAQASGQEEWSQEFRLGAYATGQVPISFNPVRVKAGSEPERIITVAPIEVQVRSRLEGSDGEPGIDLEHARQAAQITGIEELPPQKSEPSLRWPALAAALAAFIAGAAVVGVVLRRLRREARALRPLEWANQELHRIEQQGQTGQALAEQLAVVLREFTARHHTIPAPQLTTSELFATIRQTNWPAESIAGLKEILEWCDQVKFAGVVPLHSEVVLVIARAREWLNMQRSSTASGRR